VKCWEDTIKRKRNKKEEEEEIIQNGNVVRKLKQE
jgi:hypothetical protein